MRIGIYGGVEMASELWQECRERLYIDRVQIYVLTELGPVVALLVEEDKNTNADWAGTQCLSHDSRIVTASEDAQEEPEDVLHHSDVRENILRSQTMRAGYPNREEDTVKPEDEVVYT